jgi:ABC-type transport system involved in multi-copper enzyme maturation permease subunit
MKAFPSLLRKEWLALRPFAFLLLALFLFGVVYSLSSEYIDRYSMWHQFVPDTESVLIMVFVLSIVVALGLLVREKDEGTLLFLDALPVSRASVYLAKWVVAYCLLAGFMLLSILEVFIYDRVSQSSLSPPIPWRSYLIYTGLVLFLTGFFLSLMISLSFTRRWALLILGGCFWVVYWMTSLNIPYVDLLNPFSLIQRPDSIDGEWLIPWLHLGVLASVGTFAFLVGLFLFSLRTEAMPAFWRRLRDSWFGKLMGVGVIIAILFVWIAFFYVNFSGEEESESSPFPDVAKPEAGSRDEVLTKESKHFRFVYRRKDNKRMKALIPKSDDIFVRVADFLEVPAEKRTEKITVDISNHLGAHNAGQAYWKKVRMSLPGKNSNLSAEAILGHEVTHVLADQITDGRLEERFDATRWFHEGLASYVECLLFESEAKERAEAEQLALASSWGEVHFSELVDNDLLTAKRDPFLVYAAGRIWVEAMVKEYGEAAPAKLLRAIGRPEAPRNLGGLARWRDACLAAGFDLERVRSRFRSDLKKMEEEQKDSLSFFPELTEAQIFRKGTRVILQPDLDEVKWEEIPEGGELVCRLRPQWDSAPGQYRYSKLNKEKQFSVPSISFLKPQLQFQIGWITGLENGEPVFGEWSTGTIEAP